MRLFININLVIRNKNFMQKSVVFILLLFISNTILAQLYPQPNINIQHYKFEIDINDSNNIITGKCTATIKFTGVCNSYFLHLVNQNDTGVGMKINSVLQDGMPISYKHFNNKIIISNNPVTKNGDIKTIEISYEGIPADGLIISKNIYGQRTFFSDNWPGRIKNWLPTNDHPADKASIEFLVTAPDKYKVVSNGILQYEKRIDNNRKLSYWKEDVALPTKVFALGIADFEVEQSGMVSDSIPIYSWVFPENKKTGFYEYGIAPDVLNYFVKNIAPYPYKKLANVQSKTMFGGMENAGAIFYYETSTVGDRKNESLIAHEIAHQWFGDMVTEKSFDHLWLSEGFASYFTHLYLQNKYGIDTLKYGLQSDRNQIIDFVKQYNAPVVDTTQTNYMNLLNANSYQKGSWVLHMLHHKVGDSLFWKIIQTYYKQYAGSNANTNDFKKVAETVSKQNLSQFFKQWLYTPGIPQLRIVHTYNITAKKLKITITQLQKQLFTFPISFTIDKMNKTENINKRTTVINMPLGKKPSIFLVDEEVNLLFEEIRDDE